jgi:phosphotransferase system  glucose/maltose/N-acetylglucosamine-specific IIC component
MATVAHEPRAHRIGAGLSAIGFVQWWVAALLLGAGAVHLALAPSHFEESTLEGAGFLVAAWLQVILAVAVVLRLSRRVAMAIVAVSAACIAAWVVSRTAGLPFGAHAGHAGR